LDISICSYSFHRLLAAGKQDIFQFITDCKALGCTLLDPWNVHLPKIGEGDKAVVAGGSGVLTSEERDYVAGIREAADKAGMPFGCIAVDGAHIYEADPAAREANRLRAYRWLEIAEQLGARQMRIDAGGPEDMPSDVLAIIKDGYLDLIARGKPAGIEIIVENHWGPTMTPDNVIRLLETVPGLGYLFDTQNWKPEVRDEARRKCAKYATATHIKTLTWDDQGNEAGEDVETPIRLLLESGYQGCWGIESCPVAGDEYEAAARTVALIKRNVPA